MARIDRQRFSAARFPITVTIPVRFADLDVQGHVNNAAAVTILQEARVDFNRRIGLVQKRDGLRVMVAALSVEYAGEIGFGSPLAIGTGVLAVGRTSVTLGHLARQDGTARLFAESVLVVADGGGPTPVPEALRAAYDGMRL